LGQCLAKKAVFSGHKVWATTRNPTKAASLRAAGIEPLIADWTDKRTLCELPSVDQILIAVAYDRQSGRRRYESQVIGLRNLVSFLSPKAHICYISTTGVYHQSDGSWVDETSPTRPLREGGQVHLWAEELLHRIRPNSPLTILRLAGIYGPGRIPRARDVIAGRPIASPEHGFLNLIHVEDAADAVMAAWSRLRYGLYVVADDCPVIRGEFYREIAAQCHAPSPRFIEPRGDAPVTMRSESNKRVWNRRMKRDLVARLRYPTFREGLASIL
jgi:nucleoside-diphosphate-sugar epimerase